MAPMKPKHRPVFDPIGKESVTILRQRIPAAASKNGCMGDHARAEIHAGKSAALRSTTSAPALRSRVSALAINPSFSSVLMAARAS